MVDLTTLVRTLAIAVLSANIGGSVVVLRLYYRARKVIARTKTAHDVGLTPLHVSLLASGMILTQSALLWAFISAVSTPTETSWQALARSFMWLGGSAMICAGLIVVANIQRTRRLHFTRSSEVVVRNTDTTVARNE